MVLVVRRARRGRDRFAGWYLLFNALCGSRAEIVVCVQYTTYVPSTHWSAAYKGILMRLSHKYTPGSPAHLPYPIGPQNYPPPEHPHPRLPTYELPATNPHGLEA